MKTYLPVIKRDDAMEYNQVLFRKRDDLSKVYVFLPKTGKMLETKSKDVTGLYELLNLMKLASVQELEELNDANNRGLLKGSASEAFDVYHDLKSLQISFTNNPPTADVLKKYIKRHSSVLKDTGTHDLS